MLGQDYSASLGRLAGSTKEDSGAGEICSVDWSWNIAAFDSLNDGVASEPFVAGTK